MGLRSFLLVLVAAVVAEVAVVIYWIDSAAFDCYPGCSTSQTASGWIALLLPVAVLVLAAASLARWLRHRAQKNA
jgi:hypothetical protein